MGKNLNVEKSDCPLSLHIVVIEIPSKGIKEEWPLKERKKLIKIISMYKVRRCIHRKGLRNEKTAPYSLSF